MAENRLEVLYPLFKDQIKAGLDKGFSEPEIEGRIHAYITGLRDQGYEASDIVKHINPLAAESRPEFGMDFLKQVSQDKAGFLRNVIRGFGEGATLGYVPSLEPGEATQTGKFGIERLPDAATPGEQAGRAVGEFAGGAIPFGGAFKAAGAVLPAAKGVAGTVLRGTAQGLAGLVGTAAAAKPGPEETRLGNVSNVLTENYGLNVAGAVAGGIGLAVPAAKAARAAKIAEVTGAKQAQAAGEAVIQERKVRMAQNEQDVAKATTPPGPTTTPPADVELTVGAKPKTVEYLPNQWTTETLIDEYTKDVVRGVDHKPEVAAEVARRSVEDPQFRRDLTSGILGAQRAIEEAKLVGQQTPGTVGKKAAKEVLSIEKRTGEVGFSGLTDNELNAARNELTLKMQDFEGVPNKLRRKIAATPKTHEAIMRYQKQQDIALQMDTEIASRQAKATQAQEYSGDVNLSEPVRNAIGMLEQKIVNGDTNELYPRAISELRQTGRLTDRTAADLGIKRTVPDPGPMQEAEPPTKLPEGMPKPPKEVTRPVVSVSVGAEEKPLEAMNVRVWKEGKVTSEYPLNNLEEAQSLASGISGVLEASPGTRVEIVPAKEPEKLTAAQKSRRAVQRQGMVLNWLKENNLPNTAQNRVQAQASLFGGMPGTVGVGQAMQEGLAVTGRTPAEKVAPSVSYTDASAKLLADSKGSSFHMDKDTGAIRIVHSDGQVFNTDSLKTATEHLLRKPDEAKRSVIDKAMDGKPLTQEDRKEIQRFSSDQLKVEPRETEVPILNEVPTVGPPVVPPISGGGAGGLDTANFLMGIAIRDKMSAQKASDFVNNTLRIFGEYPHLEAAFRLEQAKIRNAFYNPVDYIGMPQSSTNAFIRTITNDAVFKYALPKSFEHNQWKEYFNTHWSQLGDKDRRDIWLAMRNRKPESQLSAAAQKGLAAAQRFVEDVGQRLGVGSNWVRYLSGIIDHQTVYEGWRNVITAYKTFDQLPIDLQGKFGHNPTRFETTLKAFEKNDKYDGLPRSVKATLDNDLIPWFDKATYSQLPDYIKNMVPDEMWRKFSMKGGFPLIEDWNTTFRAILPVVLDELYTKGWEKKWSPLWETLPGGVNGTSTKAYMDKWWHHANGGAERSGASRFLDGIISNVEDWRGTHLADPNFLDRLASGLGRNLYRATLGFALDTATANLAQGFNNWAETGRVTRGMMARMMSSDRRAIVESIPGGVGIMDEFSWHTMRKSGEEMARELGVPLSKWKQIGEKIQQFAMTPMQVTEHINRTVAFYAALDAALAQGLDAQTAFLLGTQRASRVVNNLSLSKAQMAALETVSKTQFSYQPIYQSPYMQGPLAKLSTMFWSFPTKQLQFVSNRMGQSLYNMATHPSAEDATRFTRFAALTGLFLAGPTLGKAVGVNLESVFSPQGLFAQLATIPLKSAMTMYNLVLGREPIKPAEWRELWRNSMYALGFPGTRYFQKVGETFGVPGVTNPSNRFYGNIPRGMSIDNYGRNLYENTPWGEFTRLFGLETGRGFTERSIAREAYEQEVLMQEQRKQALRAAVNGDTSKVDKFNQEWAEWGPGTAITGDTIANWAESANKTYMQRRMDRGTMRHTMEQYGYTP